MQTPYNRAADLGDRATIPAKKEETEMYRWIKLTSEAQSAAKWCARRNFDGSVGTPLPVGISSKAFDEIVANPIAFKMAIHIFKSFKS